MELQEMRAAAENTKELVGIERGISKTGDYVGGWAKVYRQGWQVPAYDEVTIGEATKEEWSLRQLQDEAERLALTMAFPTLFSGLPASVPAQLASPADVPGGDPVNQKKPAPEVNPRSVIADGITLLHAGFAKPPSEATKLKVRMHFCGTPDPLEAKVVDLGAESLLWQALADQKHQKYQRAFELCQEIIKNTAKKGASI